MVLLNTFVLLTEHQMEPPVRTNVRVQHLLRWDIQQYLQSVSNKVWIHTLEITCSIILELNNYFFDDFVHLVHLNLSNCCIYCFEFCVLDKLVYLRIIDLSHNVITVIDNSLFQMNRRLRTIILSNNLLDSIDRTSFSMLEYLEFLDLSYNRIEILNEHFLDVKYFGILFLNNNKIRHISHSAFDSLPFLSVLSLSDNEIEELDYRVFNGTQLLQHLNLSHNKIRKLNANVLSPLTKLRTLCLNNNNLAQKIYFHTFGNNSQLLKLDMLNNNEISTVEHLAFDSCPNLKYLNLNVRGYFNVTSIANLRSLITFQLIYDPNKHFILNDPFLNCFHNKDKLREITFIFLNFINVTVKSFSALKNLEYLHIECQKRNNRHVNIYFDTTFHQMSKLKTVTLKHLNDFWALRCDFESNHLTYLDLTGVQNKEFDYCFKFYMHLIYLNLSFSAIESISGNSFNFLINLEYLNLEYSLITSIDRHVFKNTKKLKILNCAHCHLQNIESYSFENLRNLKFLDLRNNPLPLLSENVFYGIDQQLCQVHT